MSTFLIGCFSDAVVNSLHPSSSSSNSTTPSHSHYSSLQKTDASVYHAVQSELRSRLEMLTHSIFCRKKCYFFHLLETCVLCGSVILQPQDTVMIVATDCPSMTNMLDMNHTVWLCSGMSRLTYDVIILRIICQ